jgi:coiled-coil domain-containing protein 77
MHTENCKHTLQLQPQSQRCSLLPAFALWHLLDLSCKQALSDAQQFLFEERQRLLHVQSENDELKLQEIQDRQRIQQLLAMTQPLEQTITHRQDGGPPCSVTVFPKPYPQHAQQQQQQSRGARSPQRGAEAAAGVAAAGSSGERVLRTVFLPTVDCDFLLLKVESLQAQLNEQVRVHMAAPAINLWRQSDSVAEIAPEPSTMSLSQQRPSVTIKHQFVAVTNRQMPGGTQTSVLSGHSATARDEHMQ